MYLTGPQVSKKLENITKKTRKYFEPFKRLFNFVGSEGSCNSRDEKKYE
jgi:hypothetical protein